MDRKWKISLVPEPDTTNERGNIQEDHRKSRGTRIRPGEADQDATIASGEVVRRNAQDLVRHGYFPNLLAVDGCRDIVIAIGNKLPRPCEIAHRRKPKEISHGKNC